MKKTLLGLLLALTVASTGQLLPGCVEGVPPAQPSSAPADPVTAAVGAEPDEARYVERGQADVGTDLSPITQPSPAPPDPFAPAMEAGPNESSYVEKGDADVDTDLIPAAEPSSAPPDPLAAAAEVGLNQAWYIKQGYTDDGTDLAPIAPAHFPSPTPASQIQVRDDLDHRVFLPLLEKPKVAEARALWVTRWDYSSVADVETLVANAAGAGFNIVLFQVRGTADAYYASNLEPWAARLTGTLGGDPGWDPLQTAVDAAHAHGIELHAYINVYPVWSRSKNDTPQEMAPPESADPEHLFWTLSHRYDPYDVWRITDSSMEPTSLYGTGYLWPSPAVDEVEGRVVAVARDLTRYAVDGIHLDLVRYPGPEYSYDPFTEAALGETQLPRAEWQQRRVTELVTRIYAEAILPRPDVWLSAAVWPVYQNHWGWTCTEGYSDLYQDSQGWMEGGAIDAILPMIYPVDVLNSPETFTPDQFSVLTSDFLNHDGGRHVLPGISAQYRSFDEIAQRIAIARDLGAPGHAVFSARLVTGDYPCAERLPCHNPYWDDFAAGPYATEASVPSLPWRQ